MSPLYDKTTMIYEAKKLRRKGLTSSEISTKLGIPKSTVFSHKTQATLIIHARIKNSTSNN